MSTVPRHEDREERPWKFNLLNAESDILLCSVQQWRGQFLKFWTNPTWTRTRTLNSNLLCNKCHSNPSYSYQKTYPITLSLSLSLSGSIVSFLVCGQSTVGVVGEEWRKVGRERERERGWVVNLSRSSVPLLCHVWGSDSLAGFCLCYSTTPKPSK